MDLRSCLLSVQPVIANMQCAVLVAISACDFLLAIYRVGTHFHARFRFLERFGAVRTRK